MALKTWYLVVSMSVLGCGDDQSDDSAGSETGSAGATSAADGSTGDASMSGASMSGDASMSGASMSDASVSGSSGDTSGTDTGDDTTGSGQCMPAEPGRLCVRGTPNDKGEQLVEDEALAIRIEPYGCFSSACTVTEEATCTVSADGMELTATAGFCIGTEGSCDTPDCSGADAAECESPALPAGDYTVTLGELSVSFTIPSTIEFGGLCDGSTV